MKNLLDIEKALEKGSVRTKYYARYELFRERLFNYEYEHWGVAWGQGNNHGPAHIRRVLKNLDRLLGGGAVSKKLISIYELFLTMMAILYHDVGILRGRAGHAKTSGEFILNESEIFFDERDVDIVRAAVISHSSSASIDEECQQFSHEEYIGSETVRPRLVAALVRLADELDEDFRRADPSLQQKIGITEESEFYWEFCQRIRSVRPIRSHMEIVISVKFKEKDPLWQVLVAGKRRLFVAAFAEKLAKINRERVEVNRHLPEKLQYQRVVLSVKATNGKGPPREFTFRDETLASEFARSFPELTVQPIDVELGRIWELVPKGGASDAHTKLDDLAKVADDLHTAARLRVLWGQAVFSSLIAEKSKGKTRTEALRLGVEYLSKWYEFGSLIGWRELGYSPANEIFRISDDRDMRCLYEQRKGDIERLLGSNKGCLVHYSDSGGGGCIPGEVAIATPKGPIQIRDIDIGDRIYSAELSTPLHQIETTVVRLIKSSTDNCVTVNEEYTFTESQPLYTSDERWVFARDINVGTELATIDGMTYVVLSVERTHSEGDVYTLTTDHNSHNFVVGALICRNKDVYDGPPDYNKWIL